VAASQVAVYVMKPPRVQESAVSRQSVVAREPVESQVEPSAQAAVYV